MTLFSPSISPVLSAISTSNVSLLAGHNSDVNGEEDSVSPIERAHDSNAIANIDSQIEEGVGEFGIEDSLLRINMEITRLIGNAGQEAPIDYQTAVKRLGRVLN